MIAGAEIVVVGRVQPAQQQAVAAQHADDAVDQRFGLVPQEIVQRQAGDDDTGFGERPRRADILAMELGRRHARPRLGDRPRRQVDGNDAVAGLDQHRGIAPAAAAQLQHRQAGRTLGDQVEPARQPGSRVARSAVGDIARADGAGAEFFRNLAADIGEGLLHRRDSRAEHSLSVLA